MTFEEKVKAMSAKEIIMAMVIGLRKKHVGINMLSFGSVMRDQCFGCAATNAICEISGVIFDAGNIKIRLKRAEAVGARENFLDYFEMAVDSLRLGNIEEYNYWANLGQFAKVTDSGKKVPLLNDFSEEDLEYYVQLAEKQN